MPEQRHNGEGDRRRRKAQENTVHVIAQEDIRDGDTVEHRVEQEHPQKRAVARTGQERAERNDRHDLRDHDNDHYGKIQCRPGEIERHEHRHEEGGGEPKRHEPICAC